ncbi:MAG TPA: AMP-binding protein [Steroidobacteraceae bacterium]|jgi:long-chain acyl-CoA synthetase|nr:AMP-binding protein [Steroidobacteraceae bacterium]
MDKVWLQSYPPGVPEHIDPNAYRSLTEMIEESFTRFRERGAFVQMGRELTFGELDALSRDFAAWLQNEAGLRKGDRVAIMLPNILQYPIAMCAILRAGLVVVNTNPLYTARELEHQLKDSGAQAILILENFAHVLQEVIAHTNVRKVIVTAVGDLLHWPKSWIVNFVVRHQRKQVKPWSIPGAIDFRDVLKAGREMKLTPVPLGQDDIAFLQYTGGTTGVAKGAMLTHRNIVANVLQALGWIGPSFPKDPQISVTPLPLYHIFALTANGILFMMLGWKNVLITNPRDLPAFVAELKKYPFAYLSGVNTLFNALMNTPGFDRVDFSHLLVTVGGGMAVQAAVAERWKKITGKVLTQAWGLTETSPGVCINPIGEDFNGSIGLPIPSTEVAIMDDDGNELPIGAVGEICVRGPQVMAGYWNRPDETAKVMLPGGWLRTGDIGHIDAKGYVYIEDRKKDMILVSGFNVYPNEVESVIATHPGVLEVAAVAQPDEHSGEVVAVFIVRKDPTVTERDIIAHAKQSLTGYKVPKHVYFRDELPKTNVGKILRRALRDELASSVTAQVK